MLSCTVIICTLNPPQQQLDRVLRALQRQTLPVTEWELFLVDNGSTVPVSTHHNLSWHPHGNHVREEQPGQLAARVCGYQHSSAPLLIFVDDDNLLYPDYLELCLQKAAQYPQVAVWSGQSFPEFDSSPAEWTRPWWPMLAIAEFDTDEVADSWNIGLHLPNGAGMAVRKTSFASYTETYAKDPMRSLLGRKGPSLMSADDNDIALHAFSQGSVTARFCNLKLTHLISSARLTADYLLRLTSGMAASRVVLSRLYPQYAYATPSAVPFTLRKLWHWLRWPSFARSHHLAVLNGEQAGYQLLRSFE